MEFFKNKNGEVLLTGDANNPETWNMYSFEVLPNIHDAAPLNTKEKNLYFIIMSISLLTYFGIIFML